MSSKRTRPVITTAAAPAVTSADASPSTEGRVLGPGIPPDLLLRQLHVVMGKGGVGKSMVSLGLALGLARRGKRVLLCQVNAPDAHGPVLGTSVGSELKQVRLRLTAVNIEPRAALREYMLMVVKFQKVYEAIFENRFVSYFLRFVPSLAEINMLGKVWFHAEEKDGARPRWDHIVVDAPATGHGITFLKVARVVSRTAPPGTLREQTDEMARVVEDAARTAVHVVTTPDELSVMEAEELLRRLSDEKVAPLGTAILNRVPEGLFTGLPMDTMRRLQEHTELGPLARLAVLRQREETAALAAGGRLVAHGLPLVMLPESPTENFSLPDAEHLATALTVDAQKVEAHS
ncbi:MAG: ArsA-related P-loop ATPase [Myxococcota bacterium]